jgi:hypothetical protein
MKQEFCKNESEARVEVYAPSGTVSITSKKTPIYIRHDPKSFRILLIESEFNQVVQNLGLFPPLGAYSTLHLEDLYFFSSVGTTDLVYFTSQVIGKDGDDNNIYAFVPVHSIKDNGFQNHWRYGHSITQENTAIFSISSDSDLLYTLQIPIIPQFKVFCDGCQPGDCRASKAKYPGYTCMDCKDLEARLKNSGRKIDNVQRR